jgi:hypothetical protein
MSTDVLDLSSLFLQRMIHLSNLPSSAQITQSGGMYNVMGRSQTDIIFKLIPTAFCTMTNKCTIISQIITFLPILTISCNPHSESFVFQTAIQKFKDQDI